MFPHTPAQEGSFICESQTAATTQRGSNRKKRKCILEYSQNGVITFNRKKEQTMGVDLRITALNERSQKHGLPLTEFQNRQGQTNEIRASAACGRGSPTLGDGGALQLGGGTGRMPVCICQNVPLRSEHLCIALCVKVNKK